MTSDPFAVGFLGFGEAGFAMASGLRKEGVARMYLCHLRKNDPARTDFVKKKAREAGAEYLDSIREVVERADFIFSVVTPEACLQAAREAVPYLKAGQVFLDLTSSFPADMKAIEAMVVPTGAKFVDGVMLGPLPAFKHAVLTYVAGTAAEEVAQVLNGRGMNLRVIGKTPGQASAIKLLLSVATKGFEALLVEMLFAAHHYGVEENVLAALRQFFTIGLDAVVNRCVGSDAVHAGRRVKEMESSVKLLQEIGVAPIMAGATVQRLQWSASLGLSGHFGGVSPEGYPEVIKAWEAIGLFAKEKNEA